MVFFFSILVNTKIIPRLFIFILSKTCSYSCKNSLVLVSYDSIYSFETFSKISSQKWIITLDFLIVLLLSQSYCHYYYNHANPSKEVPTEQGYFYEYR